MNLVELLLTVAAGLVLFLFAVSSLSEVIQNMAGDNARTWILRFTSHTFTAILTGIVVTTVLDSSSAVIILTIVLVNSRLLTFRQAMGIVLGANIGTTVSSQIIAMDVGKYSPVFLVAGFVLLIISRTEKLSHISKALLYFGMLFFGLYTMERAVEPLKEQPYFLEWMKAVESPLIGTLTGGLVTLIIQSSSATVGMAIVLSKKGLLSLAGGMAVMLGAELGTCSDTLLATLKGSPQALKTGLFHLLFNFLSIVLGLLFFTPFVTLVAHIGKNVPVERSLANAHMLFNIGGVVVFVWFVPLFEKLLDKLIPEKKAEAVSQYESV